MVWVAGAIAGLSTGAVTVRRRSGAYVAGDFVASADETLTLRGLVHPATGADLKKLPEGERTEGVVRVYTIERIRLSDRTTGQLADRITYGGVEYEARTVEDWAAFGYYLTLAGRVEG